MMAMYVSGRFPAQAMSQVARLQQVIPQAKIVPYSADRLCEQKMSNTDQQAYRMSDGGGKESDHLVRKSDSI
jgi:hypothetical protein